MLQVVLQCKIYINGSMKKLLYHRSNIMLYVIRLIILYVQYNFGFYDQNVYKVTPRIKIFVKTNPKILALSQSLHKIID